MKSNFAKYNEHRAIIQRITNCLPLFYQLLKLHRMAFRRILKFIKPYKIYLFFTIFFNVLYSLLAIVSVTSLFPILQILFKNTGAQVTNAMPETPQAWTFENAQQKLNDYIVQNIAEHGALQVLAVLCVVTIILFFLRNLFRYLAQYFMVGLRSAISFDIRRDLYHKILNLPVSFFTEQRKGDFMSRVSSDVDNIQRFMLMPLIEIIRSPFMIIATLSMLFYMNLELTLVTLALLPIMGFVISTISKSLKKDARKAQGRLGILISKVEETLNASKIIKIFNAQSRLEKNFEETNSYWQKFTNRVERKSELSSPTSEFLGSMTMIMLVWYGGKLIIQEESMSGEVFLTFVGLFFQMLDPAKSLSKTVSDISRGTASAERVLEILDLALEDESNKKFIPFENFEDRIEFKNVWFRYNDQQWVVKDFSLSIRKGETVALVGQSGSGKTTIANLLSKFYLPTCGQILIDGKDISEINSVDFRSHLGMVTQESVLFNDSIFANIHIGKEEASLEEVENAAKIANAYDFIQQFPEGFTTNIGEGGGKLSGGQKQRISIARAILKNPAIMILDEATSALDTQSERLVQEALEHMMQNRTSLIIAHRLSTIQKADKIVVMKDGEIIEIGRHQELMEKNGVYAQLIAMQNFS